MTGAGRGKDGARHTHLPQGMMTSAWRRLGDTNWSCAGLTKRVYCAMTPAVRWERDGARPSHYACRAPRVVMLAEKEWGAG